MKNTCLILGAGFSKSMGNLPVTKEMYSAFQNIMVKERDKNKRRFRWGEEIMNFIEELENDFLKIPYSKIDKEGVILESNYFENFEGLCSFIDLNLAFEVHALCEHKGERADLSNKSMFAKYTTSKLKEIRGCIGNYLYLTLIDDKSNEELLNKFYYSFIQDCSSIVTFNYDLILEKYLYKKEVWFPKDGYGFSSQELPEINSSFSNSISKVEILKMHGSLNWKPSSLFHSKMNFRWFDDDSNYFFPGYL